MKKFLSVTAFAVVLLTSSVSVFAANPVSQMATTEGGKSVAQCAQTMEKGISECTQMAQCKK